MDFCKQAVEILPNWEIANNWGFYEDYEDARGSRSRHWQCKISMKNCKQVQKQIG